MRNSSGPFGKLRAGPFDKVRAGIGRRGFLLAGGSMALGACLAATAEQEKIPAAPGPATAPAARPDWKFPGIPNFCAHEHWGSIASFGMAGGGFRPDAEQGATPSRRTGLLDILLDPYINMTLAAQCVPSAGSGQAAVAKEMLHDNAGHSVVNALKQLRPMLRPFRLIGTYQCIRRGLLALHGLDMESQDDEVIRRLDESIAQRYQNIFTWYPAAMRMAEFSELIRPVQPEFFIRQQSPETAAAEAAFTHTVVRIDPFLQLWRPKSGRRDLWSKTLGVEPVDAASWRRFLGEFFDLAAKNKTLGMKQMQAYSRSLEYLPVQDKDVVWKGDLTDAQIRVFQDWVMNECCKQANDRGWPHHIHVGTHNLPDSRPRPLSLLASRYPKMKIVMLHCWPYLKEAGWMAEQYHNIYIDTNSLSLHGAGYFKEALAGWMNYLPTHKIMCSHDGTSVEMAAGSAVITREVLAAVLAEQTVNSGLTDAEVSAVAADLLQNNSVAMYGIGNRT